MHPTRDSEFSRNSERFDSGIDPYEPEVGSLPDADAGNAVETDTGTTIVGIVTDGAVVMATDMRASLGGRVVSNKDVQKVEEVQPNAAITISGSVGGAQSFIRTVRAEASLYEARRGEYMDIEALSTMAANLLRGGPFFRVAPLLGGYDDEGGHVYSLDPTGSSLPDDYSAQGSGMPYALGVLENQFEEGLSTERGREIAAQAIQSASERDTASGNGVYLAEIGRDQVVIEGHKEFDELL